MTADRTSSGDPTVTLELLWRDVLPVENEVRPGPRRALDVDVIVAVATALADEEGLRALTMRRLAQRLDVGPMSLYTYVPGRAELLDLMLDAVYLAMPRPDRNRTPWHEQVRATAEDNRALYERHAWAAHVSTLRPPLGPGQMAKYEYELAAFDGAGLDDVTRDDALTHLLTFVRAAARDAADARAAELATGGKDQGWWNTVQPLLDRVLDPTRFPLAARIGAAAGTAHASAHDPLHAYVFGLDRVLDAFDCLAAAPNAASGIRDVKPPR